MRTAIAVFAVLALVAASAQAGPMKACKADSLAAPGGSAGAEVQLVNDGSKTARFKVYGRILPGENGGRKGKRVKHSVTLGPGEGAVVNLSCPVPEDASGAVKIEIQTRGPGVKDSAEEDVVVWGGWEGGDPPGPGDDPDRPDDKLIELEGTLTVVRGSDTFKAFDEGPEGFAPWVTYLELEEADGTVWNLVGPEAHYLARLMLEAGLTETTGTVVGIPLRDFPTFDDPTMPPGNVFRGKPDVPPDPGLFVLSWTARGIEDPRLKIVPHRWVIAERLCKIAEARTAVIDDEDAWETLLATAGIVLPEELPPWEVFPMEYGKGGRPDNGAPEIFWPWQVNFDRETVLAVFAGEKLSTGYFVDVLAVLKENDGSLTVKYVVYEPSEYEVLVTVPTAPFTIVSIPKTDAEINFVAVDPADIDEPIYPWYGPWYGMDGRMVPAGK